MGGRYSIVYTNSKSHLQVRSSMTKARVEPINDSPNVQIQKIGPRLIPVEGSFINCMLHGQDL